jgi:ABC-2 type transport system permease protein
MSEMVFEFQKLGAFIRRDFLTAVTYRMAFISDWIALLTSAFLFYFTGKIVDTSKLPSYNGTQPTYMQFVVVGLALTMFVTIALNRVAAVMRQEQFAGTLESLLMTPTAPFTVQLGSVMYDLLFIPIRIALFTTVVAIAFGLGLDPSGIGPSLAYIVGVVPFVWGLGLVSAGITMTLRQGGAVVTFGIAILSIGSGAYFPTDLLPSGLETLMKINPLTIGINGMRDALLGGTGWSNVPGDLAILLPLGAAALLAGNLAFRVGVKRERKRGTLGLY